MKLFSPMLFLLIICFSSCKNDEEKILSQNNMIVEDQIELYRLNDNLFELIGKDDPYIDYSLYYDSLKQCIKLSIIKYDTLTPATEDNTLVQAMKEFLLAYENLAHNEYKMLLKIVTKPKYDLELHDLKKIDSLYPIIEKKQEDIYLLFSQKQEEFSNTHNISLIDK
jgi:hypothetical protein